MAFELPELPYAHDALEPHIDTKTMQIHHGKHHAGYTAKLNAAVAGTDLEGKSIVEILRGLDMSNGGSS
jgi:Fe-Mn family superoxide dismutase